MGRQFSTRTESRRARDAGRNESSATSARRRAQVVSRNEIGMQAAAVDSRPVPRRRVDLPIASTPGAEIRLPAVPSVHNKWRVLSGVLAVSILVGLILISQASRFKISEIEVEGLERYAEGQIAQAINITGSTIFFVNPDRIKKDLELTYPGLSDIEVKVTWPASVSISLLERYPVLAWNWDGHVRWVDKNGVAFEPLDEGLDVVQIKSPVLPPTIQDRFVDPRIVEMVKALAPFIPQGSDLIYDQTHGLGWEDARGWIVYFGFNDDDADQKMIVYQALVDYLENRRITPRLINVEFVNSPYFRMEQ